MGLAGDLLSPKKLKLGTVAAESGKVVGAVCVGLSFTPSFPQQPGVQGKDLEA